VGGQKRIRIPDSGSSKKFAVFFIRNLVELVNLDPDWQTQLPKGQLKNVGQTHRVQEPCAQQANGARSKISQVGRFPV
jgi:hypothetical protein